MSEHASRTATRGAFNHLPLHDAVLSRLVVDWARAACVLELHAFTRPEEDARPCELRFARVTRLEVAHASPWGESASVHHGRHEKRDVYVLEMQSGDVIRLEAGSAEFVELAADGAAAP